MNGCYWICHTWRYEDRREALDDPVKTDENFWMYEQNMEKTMTKPTYSKYTRINISLKWYKNILMMSQKILSQILGKESYLNTRGTQNK